MCLLCYQGIRLGNIINVPSKLRGCAAAQCIRQRRAAVSNSAQHVATVKLISFLPRDAMLSAVYYANSVRPSVTRVICIKTAECI